MRRIVFSLAVVFFSFCFGRDLYARSYFTFETDKFVILEDAEIEVQFSYVLERYEENDFVVRPVLGDGTAKIYNEDNDTWAGQYDLWTNMPYLRKTMKVKPNFSGNSDLSFQIQNTLDAEIYETPKQTIWGKNAYSGYLSTLNKNLKMYVLEKETPEKSVQKSGTADSNQKKTAGLFAKVIKYIGEII